MADTQWYVAAGQEQKGPYREDELAVLVDEGLITENSLMWHGGLEDWQPAASVLPATLRPNSWAVAAPPLPGEAPNMTAQSAPSPSAYPAGPATDHPTGFVDSVKTVFRKFATFSGRARRPEFWWFVLFSFIASLAISTIDLVMFPGAEFGVLGNIFSLVMLVPSLAVGARRLHDIGRTGWWQLIGLIPIAGWIVLIIFTVQKGDPQANKYGAP